MKILILDLDSQVGDAMARLLRDRHGVEWRAVSEQQLMEHPEQVFELLDAFRPDFIVNAYSIEIAEHTPGLDKAHVRLIKRLCKAGEVLGAGFIHVSSAQVFDRLEEGEHIESERPKPGTTVGRRLTELESGILKATSRTVILRSGWIFGREGHGLFDALLKYIAVGGEIPINPDMMGAPTPAPDVVRVLFAIMQQLQHGADGWGIYHYCSSDVAGSRDFIETVVTMASQYGEVDLEKISFVEVKGAYSSSIPFHPLLDCKKILNTFGIKQRPWRSAMTTLLRNLYEEASAVSTGS